MKAKIDTASDTESGGCHDVHESLSRWDNFSTSVPVCVPPSILDVFDDMFERVYLPPPALRIKAAIDDRQSELDQVLRRCVESESGCWEWQGAKSKWGYGRIKIDRRLVSTHRVTAWAMGLVEDLSDPQRSACVLHRCDNPKCVNPDHLFVGTLNDNMQDCSRKGRMANQKNPWKPKQPRKKAIPDEPSILRSRTGKWILTPKTGGP